MEQALFEDNEFPFIRSVQAEARQYSEYAHNTEQY